MKESRLVIALVLALSASAAAAEIARTMADAQPWEFSDPSGRVAQLTLNPDGTGRVRPGFGAADATWKETEDGIA
ncbi:hypothetical protein [Parasulfitobacter algicola]|uniref:Uncharacterized protein n=1 Tax=Parasulfitobacter algicola TaxID=2614809 RepID=A0ABX2IWD6_9RHOB|nr:hypothetical protein [Sulfitobacter algicola]NSX56880.1 hypothetical protein [Sulfitobacter algicola]